MILRGAVLAVATVAVLSASCASTTTERSATKSDANAKSAPPKGAIVLFDGKDFSQWDGAKGEPVGWKIENGEARIEPRSGSITTKMNVRDFQMHIEFAVPDSPPEATGQKRGNSGVYIQQRYEMQILDSYGLEMTNNDCASIYKFKAPDKNVCKKPGEWQTYDITFHEARWEKKDGKDFKTANARITLIHNGVKVHNDVEIPNKTGAGQPEAPEARPILLQDHGNPVRFRNIWLLPLSKSEGGGE